MLRYGVIERCTSPFINPLVTVIKRDGRVRLCPVSYTHLDVYKRQPTTFTETNCQVYIQVYIYSLIFYKRNDLVLVHKNVAYFINQVRNANAEPLSGTGIYMAEVIKEKVKTVEGKRITEEYNNSTVIWEITMVYFCLLYTSRCV